MSEMSDQPATIMDVLASLEQITEVLPPNPSVAFEALTFAIVDLAVAENISAADIHANIDKVLGARGAAARKVLS